MSEPATDPSASLVRLVEEILAQLDGTPVIECELRTAGHRVLVRRSLTATPPVAALAAPEDTAVQAGWQPVAAPLTGIFYLTETPQSPPFVTLGGTVSERQVLGLIESMKMFNPVESEIAGTVRAILVTGGQVVEKGQILMHIEPLGDLA